jgi:hypothetical protein
MKSNKPSKPPGMYKNSAKTTSFPHLLPQKSPKKPFFTWKYLTKYTSEMFFEECIQNKICCYLRALWSYTYSKFRKSCTLPAARIWVQEEKRAHKKEQKKRKFALFFLLPHHTGNPGSRAQAIQQGKSKGLE